MAVFDISFEKTLIHEGDYSNDKYDKGGKTRFGITEKEARANGYEGDMAALPLSFAKKIYFEKYWNPLHLDQFAQEISDELFDTGVNMGIGTAGKFFQTTINLFTGYEVDPLDDQKIIEHLLVVDGNIGPKTIEAFDKILKNTGVEKILKVLNILQGQRYIDICLSHPTQKKFIRGWLNRVEL